MDEKFKVMCSNESGGELWISEEMNLDDAMLFAYSAAHVKALEIGIPPGFWLSTTMAVSLFAVEIEDLSCTL